MQIKVPSEAEETLVFVQGGFLEAQPNVITVVVRKYWIGAALTVFMPPESAMA